MQVETLKIDRATALQSADGSTGRVRSPAKYLPKHMGDNIGAKGR